MNKLLKHTNFLFLLFFAINLNAQKYHVRIGFIGNSITIGSFLSNPEKECYPAQLAVMLKTVYGDTCVIRNFAVSGRTMLKKGDAPIWNEASFKECFDWAPDICFISLGTNDSKPWNWDYHKKDFYSDYKSMIDTFKFRNPRTLFVVCDPDPAFGVVYDIRDVVIKNEVIPLVDSIAKVTGATLVNFYKPMLDSASLFPDKIHPNARGAKAMAKIVFDKFIETDIIHKVDTGYAMVTSFKTNKADLIQKDSALISWTTINSTEASINGQKVAVNGSLRIGPLVTTNYVLKTNGPKGSDSLVLVQNVYQPALTKATASLSKTSIFRGDTVTVRLKYTDQKSRIMKDTVFNANWSVVSGGGRFIDKADNSVKFIADSTGKISISALVNEKVKASTSFTVKVRTAIESKNNGEIRVYPNPVSESMTFEFTNNRPGNLKISITDMSGRVCISKIKNMAHTGTLQFEINTSKLLNGNYLYRLELGNKVYTGKFIKQ